jgi:hypothetical protein
LAKSKEIKLFLDQRVTEQISLTKEEIYESAKGMVKPDEK